jgi:hypothetical protein
MAYSGSIRLVATNLDSTILGARIAISNLNRVTVFMGIITDAGIPTDRAGFNYRINDILKDLDEPIPPPSSKAPRIKFDIA